jgi:glutathione S-transferase
MLHLHYYPSTASMVPHILLEELAVPYQRVLVDRAVNAHKAPAYLKLNPNGLIPVLTQDDAGGAKLVLYETAAIVLHLCDTHPDAALAPPWARGPRAFLQVADVADQHAAGHADRLFLPGALGNGGQRGGRGRGEGGRRNEDRRPAGPARCANWRSHGQDWFMGAHYTALDPMCSPVPLDAQFRLSSRAGRPHLGPYLQRMLARPAVQRVMVAEQLQPPFV